MSKGFSLHIGVNSVDKNHYVGQIDSLFFCEEDAKNMKAIAEQNGYTETILLLGSDATRDNTIDLIYDSSKHLKSGDIFFLSFSGHGGQIKDLNDDEPDGYDETWCLYDGQLIDDEIFELFAGFEKEVRIIVLLDSCHSGTATREHKTAFQQYMMDYAYQMELKPKFIKEKTARKTHQSNRDLYDPILSKAPLPASAVQACVKQISSCQDNQVSYEWTKGGQFTQFLLEVYGGGSFQGNYEAFHKEIVRQLPGFQTPNYFTYGAKDALFDQQQPFVI